MVRVDLLVHFSGLVPIGKQHAERTLENTACGHGQVLCFHSSLCPASGQGNTRGHELAPQLVKPRVPLGLCSLTAFSEIAAREKL